MTAIKLKIVFAVVFLMIGSAGALFFDSAPVTFQSLESKTTTGGPILNRISYHPAKDKDVWVMQQSHTGFSDGFSKWDRLAIVVDKTVSPKVAQFYQLEPGELTFEPSKKRSLKVSCYLCHANGPRAVRADYGSFKVSFEDRLKVLVWNLRIKTYGKVVADESVNFDSKVPLKLGGAFDNETLRVKTCVKCHSDQASAIRSPLKRQHFMSIKFMVEQGIMPPLGFSLSSAEREQVLAFAQGL